jgi:16S rRNA (adenine1518-N6/adenine1519-N6)-dimethyltransferase
MAPAKLGQHFLVNKNIAEKMIREFFPLQGSILEIGPGKGILTGLLVKHREEQQNKIFAIELDKELYYKIRAEYKKNIEFINRSVLTVNLKDICCGESLNLISNVPYYISREIVDWVIRQRDRIKKGMFMMQKEFVDKLILSASSKKHNAQSLVFDYLFTTQKLFDALPGSFAPPPKVKSTVFIFGKSMREDNEKIDAEDFYLFLKACFISRRKTLLNNLAVIFPAEKCWEIFEKTKINPKVRAEQLSLNDFLSIYNSANLCR